MSQSIIGNSCNVTIATAKPLANGAHHSQQEEEEKGFKETDFDEVPFKAQH